MDICIIATSQSLLPGVMINLTTASIPYRNTLRVLSTDIICWGNQTIYKSEVQENMSVNFVKQIMSKDKIIFLHIFNAWILLCLLSFTYSLQHAGSFENQEISLGAVLVRT